MFACGAHIQSPKHPVLFQHFMTGRGLGPPCSKSLLQLPHGRTRGPWGAWVPPLTQRGAKQGRGSSTGILTAHLHDDVQNFTFLKTEMKKLLVYWQGQLPAPQVLLPTAPAVAVCCFKVDPGLGTSDVKVGLLPLEQTRARLCQQCSAPITLPVQKKLQESPGSPPSLLDLSSIHGGCSCYELTTRWGDLSPGDTMVRACPCSVGKCHGTQSKEERPNWE